MSEPRRLSDQRSKGSPALRRLILAGRSDLPDAAREEALASRLGLGVGPALARIGSVKPAAAGLGAGSAAKIGVAATLGAVTKVGGVSLLVLGTAAAVLATSGPKAPSLAPPPPPVVAPILAPRIDAPISTDRVVLPPPVPEATTPESPVVPPRKVFSATPPGTRTVAAPAPPAEEPAAGTELSLLEDAQAVLRTDPQRALDLADREASRFPVGALTQEREVIAIEALTRLGRMEDARTRARQFLRAFPGSAHAPRVASLVGLDPDAPPADPSL